MALGYGDDLLDLIGKQAGLGAPQAAAPVPVAAPAAAPAPSLAYRAGKLLGRGARALGIPGVVGSQALGAAGAIEDTTVGATPENRPERALKILGALDVTGLGARIGRVMTGGDFFEPDTSGIAGPATREYMARGAPRPAAPVPGPQSGSIGKPDAITDEQMELGGMRGVPVAAAPAAVTPAPRRARSDMGGIIGNLLRLKQVAGDAAARRANARTALDTIVRGATARKDLAEAGAVDARVALGAEARSQGAGPAEVAAITSGRSAGAGGRFSIPEGSVPMKEGAPVIVLDRNSGTVSLRTPQRTATEANIQASMKERKLTREQAVAAYRAQGFDVGGLGARNLVATGEQTAQARAQQAQFDALPPEVQAALLRAVGR